MKRLAFGLLRPLRSDRTEADLNTTETKIFYHAWLIRLGAVGFVLWIAGIVLFTVNTFRWDM